jgi:iron complex transport system substrate-binding protein
MPNLEAITAMEPELVIIFFDPGDLQASLERLGIPVLYLAPESISSIFDHIRLLGQVTGRSDQAEDVIADMQKRIDAVTARLADVQQGPRVFHELDPTLFTAGPGSFVDDLYTLLKAQNIAADTGQAYPQIDQETVIARDPEVIVLADESAGESPDTVKARPGWGNITAVKTGRVHTIDPSIISNPGPRLVDALEALAKLLYPEVFQ